MIIGVGKGQFARVRCSPNIQKYPAVKLSLVLYLAVRSGQNGLDILLKRFIERSEPNLSRYRRHRRGEKVELFRVLILD